jgi:hypothetical protein
MAGDHAAGVQQLLRFARNDVARVRDVLAYAERDPATVERLADLAGKIQRHTDPGGIFQDPQLLPYAQSANMEHFLAAHTFAHFQDFQVRPELTGFWPEGTRRAEVEGYLLEAVQKMKDQRFQPPPAPQWWDRAVMLDNGILVQVGFNGRMLGQFFPISGPGVSHYSLSEVQMVGRALFGRVPR